MKVKQAELILLLNWLHQQLPADPTVRKAPYQLPLQYNQQQVTENGLQEIAKHMCYFLKQPGLLKVKLCTPTQFKQQFPKHAQAPALLHLPAGKKPEIWLQHHPRFRPYHYHANLAHEVTHLYLNQQEIRKAKAKENELLTDSAAVYLGFGGLLLKGYQTQKAVKVKKGPGSRPVLHRQTLRLGYLQPAQVRLLIRKSSQLRKAPALNRSLPWLLRFLNSMGF